MFSSYESLIGVIPGKPYKQDGVGDMRGVKLFKFLWNEKYPEYRVVIQGNSHDFGTYYDVQIRENYWHGFNTDERYNQDIETASIDLIEEWNEKVSNGEIDDLQWKDIRERAGLSTEHPFQLEY